MCAEFAKIYGLSEELVSFEFDGDSFDKNSSPQSLEMDNEDLIDAKVCFESDYYHLKDDYFLCLTMNRLMGNYLLKL